MHTPLEQRDWEEAASKLDCQVAAIKAVAEVEAPKGGFLPSGQCTILFERHWFSKLTAHKFDYGYPELSNRKPGGYKGGEAEHLRLQLAVALNREAALQSASWGKFQIMGFNHKACGCDTLQKFINLVCTSEYVQLQLFVAYLKSRGLDGALRRANFALFARLYNGSNYAINKYDTKMHLAFVRNGGAYPKDT